MNLRSEPVQRISQALVSAEWNKLASARERQLAEHADVSYEHVLTPQILSFLKGESKGPVLDAGCGLGFLTEKLAKRFERVVGVDLSSTSIRRARLRTSGVSNLQYIHSSVEKFAKGTSPKAFNVVVANMTLQTAPKLPTFLRAVASMLRKNGIFAVTIPHPCFWPRYWHYEHEPWFRYESEIPIRHPFRISGARSLGVTTHIHRPLELYLRELIANGFVLDSIQEPTPDSKTMQLYQGEWKYPRFLAIKARRA